MRCLGAFVPTVIFLLLLFHKSTFKSCTSQYQKNVYPIIWAHQPREHNKVELLEILNVENRHIKINEKLQVLLPQAACSILFNDVDILKSRSIVACMQCERKPVSRVCVCGRATCVIVDWIFGLVLLLCFNFLSLHQIKFDLSPFGSSQLKSTCCM